MPVSEPRRALARLLPLAAARARRLAAAAAALAIVLGGSAPALAAPASVARSAPAALRPDRAGRGGGLVYGVVPPLFGTPPLRAVTARLDALRDLGVELLWLPPVTATDDPGAISYAVTDYERLRPDYGTPDDLRALVREAHARGMKVLLDIVPNHTSSGHPFFQDAEARGPASPYWGYYLRDAQGRATHDFDWVNLPKLDYANPAVRRMITAAFEYWVRTYDVDGFRVDAAWGVRDRAPDFWPALVADLRRLRPGLVLVAEASARDGYWVASGFDAAYDWTGELGHWAWGHVFDDLARVGPALDEALAGSATPMERVLRFLDNNDTGARFVTRHGVAVTRVAAVLLETLPGIPVLYTGEEVGAEYQPYDDPPPVTWEDGSGLRPLYRRLGTLRATIPALRDGAYRRVRVPGHDAAFAFVRDAGAAGEALVVLNFGPAARLRLELPAPPRARLSRDALADRPYPVRVLGPRTLELDAPAASAAVLVPAR